MKTPKYKQLADQLQTAMDQGLLLPGSRLPSVRELMAQHQVSLATVNSALRLLEEQGLLEPRAKSGYFVKELPETPRNAPTPSASRQDAAVDYSTPAEDLYPEDRFRKLMASVIRRNPHISVRVLPNSNHPRLVKELVRRSAESGCFLRESDIVITQGAEEAVSLALRAVTRPGDRVAVQAPMTPWLQSLLETLGIEPLLLDMAGSRRLVEELEQLGNSATRLRAVLVNPNFHCPTGRVMNLADKRQLLRLAAQWDLAIIEDDIFGDLQYEGARPLPIKSYDSQDDRVIYINSSCRSLAPGLQIGWLAVGETWRDDVERLKNASSSAVSELMQLVLAEFLAQGSHLPHLRRLRTRLKERAEEHFDIIRPVLGNLVPIPDLQGAYNYFLPLTVPVRQEVLQGWHETWPDLFSTQKPRVAFTPRGLCLNTSHELNDEARGALQALCTSLGNHLKQAA